ncbi:hypothetical protein [Nocardioides sp. LML1-1-1.1]|uniref:hypothetical protein n=1 Tax=Nocardioides sp. LML1-1-1.1 TaxID=3135248 RepID=UPI003425F4C6
MTPAERRALLRRHHPDLGGDPEEFVRLVATLDAAVASPGTDPAGVTTLLARRPLRAAWRRRTRLLARRVSTGLPRRLPGTRRYGQL